MNLARITAVTTVTFALQACLAATAAFAQKSIELRDSDAYPQPARRLLRAEQHGNDLSLMTEAYISPLETQLPAEFQPANSKAFQIPYIPLPFSELDLMGEVGDARFLFEGSVFRFLVHPASLHAYAALIKKYGLIYEDYWAASRSSGRSLLLWQDSKPDQLYSVKLSLAVQQSGRTREVAPSEALHAVVVSSLLEHDADRIEQETKMGAMLETFAAVPKTIPAGLIVKRLKKSDLEFLPVFAAYSTVRGETRAFLHEVARSEHRKISDVAYQFTNGLLRALIAHYHATGIMPEAHSQNMLFRYAKRRWTFRFQDMSGAAVNYDLRNAEGLDSSAMNGFRQHPNFDPEYEIERGRTYFKKAMTLHFFRGVVSSIDRAFGFGGNFETRIAFEIENYLKLESQAVKTREAAQKPIVRCEGLFRST